MESLFNSNIRLKINGTEVVHFWFTLENGLKYTDGQNKVETVRPQDVIEYKDLSIPAQMRQHFGDNWTPITEKDLLSLLV